MRLLLVLVFTTAGGAAAWSHPGSGIAIDEQGRVLIASGPRIVLIETNGAARSIVHDLTHEKFYQLHHIQRAPAGGWLTASDLGNAVWRFTTEGQLSRFYPPENDMRALAIGVAGDPFAVDPAGNLYAVNSSQDRFTQILKITPEGLIRVVAGSAWGFADGQGTAAKFADLHGGCLLATADGSLLVTDNHSRIRRIAPDGTVSTVAGGGDPGYRDGDGAAARFEGASGLATDTQGNLWVVESVGRIRKIAADGMVSTLTGVAGRSSTDGSLQEAGFDEPTGIAVDRRGDLVVLEPHEPRVRRISRGRVTTLLRGQP